MITRITLQGTRPYIHPDLSHITNGHGTFASKGNQNGQKLVSFFARMTILSACFSVFIFLEEIQLFPTLPNNPHSSGPSQTFGWVGPGRYAPLNIPNIFKAAGINTKWIAEVTPFFSICSIVCTFKFDNNHLNFSRTTRSSRLASHIPLPRRRRRLTFPTLPPPLPTM